MSETILPQLRATGPWLTDPDGNVVMLRGFNVCSKTAESPEDLGFDSRNATFLRDHGVSVVRLGLPWTNVQPELAYGDDGISLKYNMPFLESIKRTIQLLAGVGIYTLVDFHQDGYAVPWGFGAPSWAVVHGGTTEPVYGWVVNTFGGTQGGITFELPPCPPPTLPPGTCPPPPSTPPEVVGTPIQTDLNFAFDSFWSDQPVPSGFTNHETGMPFTLWEVYGAMLQFVSNYLSDQQGNILGYDPINEPEPGSLWAEGYVAPNSPNGDPYNLLNFAMGFTGADNNLVRFYWECAIPSLRAGHPDAMIWFEPNIYFDYNAPTSLPDLAAEFGNVGFNFHNYDNTSSGYFRFRNPVLNALDYQSRYDVPLLCSEFGGTTCIQDIQTVADINDENRLSSIFWAWFNNAQFQFYGGVDAAAMGVVRDMRGAFQPPNLNQAMLDAVTRPYPRVTAGLPVVITKDASNHFICIWFTRLPNGHNATGDTRIVVPESVYPGGFDVQVTPGVTWTRNVVGGTQEIVVGTKLTGMIGVEIIPR